MAPNLQSAIVAIVAQCPIPISPTTTIICYLSVSSVFYGKFLLESMYYSDDVEIK